MKLISDTRVVELIEKYVPTQYQPKPGGPVQDIVRISATKLTSLANKLMRTEHQADTVMGLSMDVDELLGKKDKSRFVIFISLDVLLEDQLAFILLHEIGHVNWHIQPEDRKKFAEHESELYADFYAFDHIKDTLGMDRALDVMIHYCSSGGMGKELSKHG